MRAYDPVTCTRCLQPRWPFAGAQPADYVCTRCRAALAGDPYTVDPVSTPDPEADNALRVRLQDGARGVVPGRLRGRSTARSTSAGCRAGSPSTAGLLIAAQRRLAHPGRPRVAEEIQKRKHVVRQQRYRQKRKGKQATANDALLAGVQT
jgi:hypothetical protein